MQKENNFSNIDLDLAIAIKLDVWKATSEYAIITQYDDTIFINFQFWNEDKEYDLKRMGSLKFTGVWAIRYSKFNKTRYYINEIDHNYHSYYQIIPNSSWLNSLKENRFSYDINWEKYDFRDYKHYIFQNNSYYIEIIAGNVTFEIKDIDEYHKKKWNE